MSEARSRHGLIKNVHENFAGRLEDHRPLGTLRRIEEDKNKRNLKGIGCEGVDWAY
jgi:hypothetical protein